MKILTPNDQEYPNKLKQINSLPEQLYVLGNEENLNKKGIAIIGSRVCTETGRNLAREFAFNLSQFGLCIISGMAKGIDTAAHIGTLEAGQKTIAVLGSGFNNVFPKENKGLFDEIIKKDGTIITEYPRDTKVSSRGFIQRNRIISGLSEAVLIIEAKYRSGTSITAEFAKKQHKTIFCIPHSISQKEGIGTNKLIQNGAILVTKPEDILNHLNIKKKQISKQEKQNILTKMPMEYLDVYNQINYEPINVEEVYRKIKKNVSEVNYILTMLEIEGYICSLPGKEFKRI